MTTTVVLPQRVEFGIVGGGIIGLALAYELAARGRRVVVLDDASRAGNASDAAAGMVAAAAEHEMEHAGFIELRRFSRAAYPDFVRRVQTDSGIDCAFRTEGTILVALDRDHAVELERIRAIVTEQGFDAQPLGPAEILDLEPNLSGRVVGGVRLPDDFHIDQRRFMQALRSAACGRGVLVASGACVERVDTDGHVQGRQGEGTSAARFEMHCEHVVVAAGSWSASGLELPGAPLPVRPVRGQILRLQAQALLHHVVRTPDVYLVPHAAGELVVGASVEEQGFDARPTAGAVHDLLRHAWRALPALYDAPLLEIGVGFRPTARDHLPILGRLSSHVAVATGHYRNGILLAPGTALLMSALLCDDDEHELLRHFEPQRFGRASAGSQPQGESCLESI